MGANKDKMLAVNIGKTISVFYNDTANSVSFKKGELKDFDSYSLLLLENENSKATLIPREKCIRIEITGGEQSLARSRIR